MAPLVGGQPITYQGRLVAGVGAEEIMFALGIAELEDDHPHRRFVLAMAMYAGHQLRSDCPTTTRPPSGGHAPC